MSLQSLQWRLRANRECSSQLSIRHFYVQLKYRMTLVRSALVQRLCAVTWSPLTVNFTNEVETLSSLKVEPGDGVNADCEVCLHLRESVLKHEIMHRCLCRSALAVCACDWSLYTSVP